VLSVHSLMVIAATLVASLLVAQALVLSAHKHGHLTMDLPGAVQKFHSHPTPRVGGIAIYLAMTGAWIFMGTPAETTLLSTLLLAGMPAFAAGLTEDITKRVTPRRRLFFTALSAALAVWLMDASIARTDIPGLDYLVSMPLGAALITIFVVAGVANSLNIIDGFNGLASMCGVIILVSVAYVAFQVNDMFIFLMALAGVGAMLGFFIWNFPAGLIFLGDGGAYFLGFYVAELAILLLHRNPAVSPMFPLLLCIYPVFETVFSMYRRKFLRDVSPGMPDGIHLHSLVYRRLMRWAIGNRSAKALTRRNSMTSPYLWMLCMMAVVPAVLFWDNTPVLLGCIVLFGVTYVVLYWRIVRFKSPRWLVFRR